jgi:hypothetical protein
MDDAELVRQGHFVCAIFDLETKPSTEMRQKRVDSLATSGMFSKGQAGHMIQAAVTAFCPQYSKY